MDAFTERMMERAKARQAKLDAVRDKTDASFPLRENNRNKVTASTSVDITKDANNRNTVTIETTVTMKRVTSKGSLKNRSFEKKPPQVVKEETSSEEESETEEEMVEKKENMSPRQEDSSSSNQSCGIRQNVKTQLKRLGQLYSDDEPNLSSPIHRNEERFNIDEQYESAAPSQPVSCGLQPSAKPARSARLAALASAINQWEDDLSHPNIGSVEDEPGKEPVTSSPKLTAGSKSPVKTSQNTNRFGSPNQTGPTMGLKQLRSSRKNLTSTPTSGSVLDKAAQYEEATSPTKKTKDPAELPLSERLALFEKNKGSAVLPKAPFASAVPIKHEVKRIETQKPVVCDLRKVDLPSSTNIKKPDKKFSSNQSDKTFFGHHIAPSKPSASHENDHSRHAISAGLQSRLAMFEHTSTKMDEKDHMKNILTEREREMEMLKNRWNRNKDAQDTPSNYSPAPPPPPMPPSPPKYEQRRSGFFYESEEEEETVHQKSPPKIVSVSHSKLPEKSYPGLRVKPVKVSPPKPGRLYPCLSDMDTESEVQESDECRPGNVRNDYGEAEEDNEEDSDESIESFGQKIKQVAERNSRSNLKRDWSSSEQSENEVINEIDDFLEEALAASSSGSGDEATPPKRSMVSPRYGTQASDSFEYSQGTGTTDDERTLDHKAPLLHTVSIYRKQQTLSMKPVTPSRHVQIDPSPYYSEQDSMDDTDALEEELKLIDEKIEELEQEVTKQTTIIHQASQALNLCYSTIEFSGSTEQVEAEKHLLVATIKRQAALHEIQRLKIECSLRPQGPNNKMLTERGSVTISQISFPLKLDVIRRAAREEQCYYLVCLIRCGEKVLATNMMSTLPRSLRDNNKLTFPNVLTLDKLYSDFKITVEVYAMTARSKEVIPHDIKYHIGTTKKDASKLKLTPKKSKGESRLVMPVVQSPGGPNAVRTSAFNMVGYVIFSLREIQRTHFTLNKVPYTSVLEGSLHLKLDCEMSVDVEYRGFLTMFEVISGFGAWHRRWCLLKGDQLSYWKYPDDERKKIAIDTIELSSCITEVIEPVSRDLCARPNTFLLETVRPAKDTDTESLVLMRDGDRTIYRHLLSADTKEERIEWCAQLNRALALMRAWGKKLPTR